MEKTAVSNDLELEVLEELAATALLTGRKIVSGEFTQGAAGAGEEKGDENVGHHAIVTKTDIAAQDFILHHLSKKFPSAKFITEEKAGGFGRVIITDRDLASAQNGLVFGVDPVDGTSQVNKKLYEYSVSIGAMIDGRHIGGAIYAPDVRGGLLVFDRGSGTRVLERNDITSQKTSVAKNGIKKSVVLVGVDLFILPQFNRFLYEFSPQVCTTNSIGSCALGLALVAAGRVDALVQPVQCPWDWFAGYPLVEKSGGKVQFYYYGDGKNQRRANGIVPLEKPDLLSYSSEKRNTAFIAGNTELVDWLFETLRRTWQPQ